MAEGDPDPRVRSRAFEFLREETALHGEVLPFSTLARGFQLEGQRVPLLGPQGIFKPAILPEMPLSIMNTEHGVVRGAGFAARGRVSHELARRALAGLAQLGLLRRVGLARATRYVSLSLWPTRLDDAAELVLTLA